MTKAEIQQTLRDLSKMINTMDKAHVKELLKILTNNAQANDDCAFFLSIDIKRTVKHLINELIKSGNISSKLTTKQLKQIFAIMGDYELYPVCKLCGQPIQINSQILKENAQTKQMFTWDHQYPKSLGGQSTLDNMQPAHKICNNKKADKILYQVNYNININVNLNMCCPGQAGQKKYRPRHFSFFNPSACWHYRTNQHHR